MVLRDVKESTYARHVRKLPSARLWLDDIEAIQALMLSQCAAVTLQAGEKETDEVADLADVSGAQLRKLVILGSNPEIKIDLAEAEVSTSDKGNVGTRSLVVDVADFVAKRKARIPVVRRQWIWLGLLSIIPIYNVARYMAGQTPVGHEYTAIVGAGTLVAFGAVTAMSTVEHPRLIKVFPRRRGDHRAFVYQNRMTWLTSAVFFALGAFVGHIWK